MKQSYVRMMRGLRRVLTMLGVVGLLDRLARDSRTALWVRSWLSVYDLEDMLALDVPWWTFDSADRVAEFLAGRPEARVFEWGSGASTVWLAARSDSVTSVEHDVDWAAHMSTLLPANAELLVAAPTAIHDGYGVRSRKAGFEGLDFADYVARIDATTGTYDLIVIDGRAREACLDRAVGRLGPGGVIVFDNVDRARYREAIARHGELDVTWTRGRTPALPYPTRTALIGLGG